MIYEYTTKKSKIGENMASLSDSLTHSVHCMLLSLSITVVTYHAAGAGLTALTDEISKLNIVHTE